MNPFSQPNDPFDVDKFLKNSPKKIEILFKSFFEHQCQEDILESPSQLKIYQVNRYLSSIADSLELIQAYNRAHASYLFLLYESTLVSGLVTESYPFYDRLKYCRNMGPLTSYDVYRLVIDSLFDIDLIFNDFLIEIDQLIIIKPEIAVK